MLRWFLEAKSVWVISAVWAMIGSYHFTGNADYPYLSFVLAVVAGILMPTFSCCNHND